MPLKSDSLRSRENPVKIREALFHTAIVLITRFRPCQFPHIANHRTLGKRKNIVIQQRTGLPLQQNICRRVIPAMSSDQRIPRRPNFVCNRTLRLRPIDNPSRVIAIPQYRRIIYLESSLQRFVILRNTFKAGLRRIFSLPNTTVTGHHRIHPVTNRFYDRRRAINGIINRQVCQMMITSSSSSPSFHDDRIAESTGASKSNQQKN